MAKENTTQRFPSWLPVTAVLVFLLLAAGLLAIMFRDLSSPIPPEAVEEQFAEQLAFFKELAFDCPEPTLPALPDISQGGVDDAWKESLKTWQAWSKKSESRPDLLDHPAIIGASVIIFSGGGDTRVRFTLKNDEDLERSGLESLVGLLGPAAEPEVNRPVVRKWCGGNENLILYENRFVDPAGVKMGAQLLLDSNHLELSSSGE